MLFSAVSNKIRKSFEHEFQKFTAKEVLLNSAGKQKMLTIGTGYLDHSQPKITHKNNRKIKTEIFTYSHS